MICYLSFVIGRIYYTMLGIKLVYVHQKIQYATMPIRCRIPKTSPHTGLITSTCLYHSRRLKAPRSLTVLCRMTLDGLLGSYDELTVENDVQFQTSVSERFHALE